MLCSSFKPASGFENKSQAIEYLNNQTIWIAGYPDFAIDEKNEELVITFLTKIAKIESRIPLTKVEVHIRKEESQVKLNLDCKDGEQCANTIINEAAVKTDGLTLLMYTVFDDGDYTEQYEEKAAKMAEAIEYLTKFYTNWFKR